LAGDSLFEISGGGYITKLETGQIGAILAIANDLVNVLLPVAPKGDPVPLVA
jgi:hypothetical protein